MFIEGENDCIFFSIEDENVRREPKYWQINFEIIVCSAILIQYLFKMALSQHF